MQEPTSIIAIINAGRVWRGGSALDADASASASAYPTSHDAVLVEDNTIALIDTTEAVMGRYKAREAAMMAAVTAPKDDARPVEAGRPRLRSARVIDCRHRYAVLPGFIDSHVHLLDGGRQLQAASLDAANSRASFVQVLRDYVARQRREQGTTHDDATRWLYGGGWSEALLGEKPTRHWLDEACGDVPMMLFSKDVHSCVVNTVALRRCHLLPQEDSANRGSGTDCEAAAFDEAKEGGRIERDADGLPTGLLRDNAMRLVKAHTPTRDTAANQQRALELATQYFLSRGFTTVFSMMSTMYADNMHEVRFLCEAERQGRLRLRVRYAVPADAAETLMGELYAPVAAQRASRRDDFVWPFRFCALPLAQGGGYCMLGAVKLFSDGSLSSHTAAMNRPYNYDVTTEGDLDSDLDDRDIVALQRERMPNCQCGLLLLTRATLRQAIASCYAKRMQCCVHAIGDRAVATTNKLLSEAANALQRAAAEEEDAAEGAEPLMAYCRNPRGRVEHCQHMSNVAKEVGRMAEHHIIASMQPCHLLFDGDYVDALLGRRRKDKSYMWRTLLRHSIHVALGSDWPVAPADVNDGLRGSVTRVPDRIVDAAEAAPATETCAASATQAAKNNSHTNTKESSGSSVACENKPTPRGHEVWNAAECLPMETALRAYTYESAYGAFLERYTGTLEVGKWADLSIWSDDWLSSSARTRVQGTDCGPAYRWWPRGSEPTVQYTIVGGIVEYEKEEAAKKPIRNI